MISLRRIGAVNSIVFDDGSVFNSKVQIDENSAIGRPSFK